MVFVVKCQDSNYENRGDVTFDTFTINIIEAKNKIDKGIVPYNTLDNEKMIDRYSYDMCSISKIANFEVSDESLNEYGNALCSAVILNESIFYGFTQDSRNEKIDEIKQSLDESLNDIEKGHYTSADEFLKELEQDILNSCESEEEKQYILLQRKFNEKTKEFRDNYSKKILELNYNKTVEMIEKSVNVYLSKCTKQNITNYGN